MKARTILDQTETPDGARLELAREADGHYVIRVGGVPLMSSAAHGSESSMAPIAREWLGHRRACKVLVGGLGMGFTCRSALNEFPADAEVTVAELLPQIVAYNRGPLGPLAEHPLSDPRTRLFQGDVRKALARGGWDVVLLDVDNGPHAVTTPENKRLYSRKGVALLARSLSRGGVLVVWSAYEGGNFEQTLSETGLRVETRRVFARAPARKGPKHTLYIGQAP